MNRENHVYNNFLLFENYVETNKNDSQLLNAFRCKEKGTEYIEINRMQTSMLRQILKIYKNPRFSLRKHLDVNFIGEQGIDFGGPTKEFFYKGISALTKVDNIFNVQLFGGKMGNLLPLCGVDPVSDGWYIIAGKLVAHSIFHEGPGFIGLSPAIVQYICTGSISKAKELVNIEDLCDLELKDLIENEVKNVFFMPEYQRF